MRIMKQLLVELSLRHFLRCLDELLLLYLLIQELFLQSLILSGSVMVVNVLADHEGHS